MSLRYKVVIEDEDRVNTEIQFDPNNGYYGLKAGPFDLVSDNKLDIETAKIIVTLAPIIVSEADRIKIDFPDGPTITISDNVEES